MHSERLLKHIEVLKIAVSSKRSFRLIIKGSSIDLITLLCSIAIALAKQQIKTPKLLPFLKKNRNFLFQLGNKYRTATYLRNFLLQNRKSYYILKPILEHIIENAAQISDDQS